MQNASPILCSGISKSFLQQVYPSVLLQDRLLRPSQYGKNRVFTALNNIDLSVAKGEWVGLYGPNGSGKTTLLKIIAQLMPPDKGSVHVTGRMSSFLGLGVGFHPERSAVENIYLNGLLHGLYPAEIRSQIEDIITFAGLQEYKDIPAKCYSSGMLLRLAFATAAHMDADIYLLDEVLAVGDMEFQQKCWQYLFAMKKAGKTVLIVSHNIAQLKYICDRVIFIEGGTIIREEISGHDALAAMHSESFISASSAS